MNKVIIFTEAFKHTGLGHLGRCTALSEILTEKGKDVYIVLDTDGTLLNGANAKNLIYLNWKEESNLNEVISSINPDEAYVDSYLADPSIYKKLSFRFPSLICIDDYMRIDYPEGATILNPGLGGKYLPYNFKKNKIITGIDSVLLRKPFRETVNRIRKRQQPKSVLVTLGGEDRYGLMPALTRFLCREYPEWIKNLIIGPAFINLSEIQAETDNNCRIHMNLSAYEMRDLMLNVDFAITAGGQTTYELNHCETPMILIETAENQRGNIRGWIEWKNTPFIGSATDLKLLDNLKRILTIYANNDLN
ncbi:hypothetical protein [Leptospira yasudae]|uniref:UDP-2,4-diacetamido-2,4, 6-trideoxy-beta-L-altropyranose hydrolase n=1 Tax=Leptospira yasudae TaxID=2202201 RepID=A0A5F2E2Z9_9LEPT|nr:hypothetical protein [Leptospira yasudae]TGL77751.1 hypothetical protein EHQ77_14150 [Leptospira yasudae]TGL81157.1 hypothetical protein EHQ83_14925 [Leptospira yasudae]TGL82558.1 hypothetical protein EHQ72_04240 [Leptospira yasudae]TGM95893.1 hypothetical protein EHR10_19415 [Leptospira yasudae]